MKLNERLSTCLVLMGAFLVVMVFGITKGPQHRQIFFWGIMIIFAIVIAIYVKMSRKDLFLLVIGMVALGALGELSEHFFSKYTLRGIIGSLVITAPAFFPAWNHFTKMAQKSLSKKGTKEE